MQVEQQGSGEGGTRRSLHSVGGLCCVGNATSCNDESGGRRSQTDRMEAAFDSTTIREWFIIWAGRILDGKTYYMTIN